MQSDGPTADAAAPRSEWSFRQGVLTAGLLLAAALAGLGGWWWITEPTPPAEFNPAATSERVGMMVDKMTPAMAYQQWVNFYSLKRPLEPVTDPRTQAALDDARHQRLVRWTLFISAAVVAGLSLLAYTQLTPRSGR